MALSGSGLRFHFSAQGLDEESLEVLDFNFIEALSTPFEVKLTLLSRFDNLSAESIVDQTGLLTWTFDEIVQRQVHGIVSQFSKGDSGHHHTQYQLTLVPALSRLKLRQNSRIFQQQSVLDIIATLFGEMGLQDYAFSCDTRFESEIREYCVQYRESDFDFISRLAAEVGLLYFFEHSADTHTLIFSDSTSKLVNLAAPFPYNALSGGVSDVPYVNGFSFLHQIKPASVTLKDNSFKKPQYSFLLSSTGKTLAHQRTDYEHFDYPGRYKEDAAGIPITQVRQEYLRRDAQVATGKSNIMQAISGFKFDMIAHGDSTLNQNWLITAVKHSGEQGAAAEEANTQKPTRYQNEFSAIPGDLPWQAKPNAKPLVTGPQTAIVVGPENEEIFCDEFGRVKVQFPWDRYGTGDADTNKGSSCWIRVSQGWAGGQYGMMAIPRIGHEVIVSFLEGDPDQPIITGRTYHATNLPPYILPSNKTKTVIRTQTHKGSGYNELSFEDEAERELVYLRAQKDHKLQINHDENLNVGNDREKHIGNDQHLHVVRDETNNVGRNQKNTIGQDISLDVTQDSLTKVGRHYRLEVTDRRQEYSRANHDLEVGGHFSQKVQGKVLIEAGESALIHTKNLTFNGSDKVVIQGPAGKIIIDSSGITLEASSIKLKGQVAVSTGASSPLSALKSAAEAGTPMVEICDDCGD